MLRPDEYFNLFVCGLCVVMALGLLLRPLNARKVLLACILFSLSYIQFTTVLISSRLIYEIPLFYFSSLPLGYSLSPLVYLYIRSFTREKAALCRNDILFFLPVLPLIGLYLHYLSLPVTDRILRIDMFYNGLSSLGHWISLNIILFAFYAVLIARTIIRVFHRENPMHRRLMRLFVLLLSWIVLLTARVISMYKGIGLLWRIVDVLICFELLLFYFHLQRYPVLMSFAHLGKPERKRRDSALAEGLNAEELNKKIEIMMDEDELFCDEELSLGRFSHALEISSHQLSAFLNDHYGKNFNAFINAYRIRFACDQIISDTDMSILSIAFASGFNSYSAFFTAFKKETGLPPREYKNSRSRPLLKNKLSEL